MKIAMIQIIENNYGLKILKTKKEILNKICNMEDLLYCYVINNE